MGKERECVGLSLRSQEYRRMALGECGGKES